MKSSTLIFLTIVATIVLYGLIYFAFSIAEKSFDYKTWSQDGGAGYAALFVIITIVAAIIVGVTAVLDSDKNKKQ